MRKVWNRPDAAVWSLVTTDNAGGYNMNICTYVTAVSMVPKLMMIAVYKDTKTLANLENAPTQQITLQLLAEDQASLVRVLGQTSGHKINKIEKLEKRNSIIETDGTPVLADALGYVVLGDLQKCDIAGDHILYVGKVAKMKNLRDAPLLTTTFLREKGYIR